LSKPAVIVAFALSLVGALLLAAGGLPVLPPRTLWAVSFLTFVPTPIRLLLASSVVAAAIAWTVTGRQIRDASLPPSVRARGSGLLIVLFAGIIFWSFRERTFHGDAYLKLHLLAERTLQSDPYVWKEPLDSLLTYHLVGIFRRYDQAPEIAVAVLSVLAGMAYVAAVLYIARILAARASHYLIYVVSLLALGATQLWFGHVENYSLVTAASMATIALAIGYLRGANRLWPVGLVAGLAISFHPQAAFMMPALLLLLNEDEERRVQLTTLLLTGAAVPIFTIAWMTTERVPWPDISNGYAGDPQLFLTPSEALSPSRLWDAVNNLWLVAPLTPVALVSGLQALRDPVIGSDRVFRYLTAVAAGLLFYHFVFQNDLPRHRDWDLYAIVAPGLTLWGVVAWMHLVDRSAVPAMRHFDQVAFIAALTFASAFTAAWVGVNHTYTLIRPTAREADLYARHRGVDLSTLLPSATLTPPDPVCTDPVGCERVVLARVTRRGDERRVAIVVRAPTRISLRVSIPHERAFLWVTPALDPQTGRSNEGIATFEIAVSQGGKTEILWTRQLAGHRPADLGWQDVFIALERFRGQTIDVILTTSGDSALWGTPWVMIGTADSRYIDNQQ
jgi:hypothetical protein